jgi:hypothetical protein
LEERKVYYASKPAPGYLQNGAGPKLRVVEVFVQRKAAASKQGMQAALAVGCSRLQYIMSAQLWKKAILVSNRLVGCPGPWLRGRALLVFDSFPSFDLSLGFLITINVPVFLPLLGPVSRASIILCDML